MVKTLCKRRHFKKIILGKATILKNEMKISHEKTSKPEKWKNRKIQKQQNIQFWLKTLCKKRHI